MASEVETVDWTLPADETNETNELLKLIKDVTRKYDEEAKLDEAKERLPVDRLQLRSQTVKEMDIKLVKRITHFWIDRNQEYVTGKPLPRLVLPEVKDDLNIDLELGYKGEALIEEYEEYRKKKWKYFLQTIKDNDMIQEYEPHFVCFGGPLGDILATVYDTDIGWKIFAEKRNGVIYLSKTRCEDLKRGYQSKQENINAYCILKYRHFITDKDFGDMSEAVKCFAINSVQIGEHKVLSLIELTAVDDEDQSVDTKVMAEPRNRDFYLRKKLLRYWCKATTQASQRLVIGFKKNNFLKTIEDKLVSDIAKECQFKWSARTCLDFLNRFFEFAKRVVVDENVVYELVYNRGEGFVNCDRLNPDFKRSVLPETY